MVDIILATAYFPILTIPGIICVRRSHRTFRRPLRSRAFGAREPIRLQANAAEEDMIECRCPFCRCLFRVASSDFGAEAPCSSCGQRLMLDTDVLAHFGFPSEITVRLADSAGEAVRVSGLKVRAKRGFFLRDVLTDTEGSARLTRDHYDRSNGLVFVVNHGPSWGSLAEPFRYALGGRTANFWP